MALSLALTRRNCGRLMLAAVSAVHSDPDSQDVISTGAQTKEAAPSKSAPRTWSGTVSAIAAMPRNVWMFMGRLLVDRVTASLQTRRYGAVVSALTARGLRPLCLLSSRLLVRVILLRLLFARLLIAAPHAADDGAGAGADRGAFACIAGDGTADRADSRAADGPATDAALRCLGLRRRRRRGGCRGT